MHNLANMEEENRNKIHLMLKSVSEQQKRLKEQQSMIQQMLQKVKDSCKARSPQNATAQVAIALKKL